VSDSGAAVVEFVMVATLLIFLLFAVLQIAVLFYVRNIVAASAADGARYAAASSQQPASGSQRASQRIAGSLSGTVSRDIPCAGSLGVDSRSGLSTTVVHCEGSIKSIFLPFGALVHISVTSRALTEGPG
jgi:Flp pilus assembly protein TadG